MSETTAHGAAESVEKASEREIRDLVGRLRASWEHGDAKAWAGEFTDDSDFVPFDGTRLRGRDENREVHRRLFTSVLSATRLDGEVESIRLIRSDVALVHWTAGVLFPWQRHVAPRRRSRQTLVVVLRDGRWQVRAFQNTRIRPMPTDGMAVRLAARLIRFRAALARRPQR